MLKNLVAHCQVTNGFLEWKNPDYLAINLPKYEGLSGTLTIKKKWSSRTLNQNALYWMWLEVISDSTGHTKDELHIIFRGLFAPKKQVKVGKRVYNIPRSTTTFTKGEFVEYLFNVEVEAGHLGIILPRPEDVQLPKLTNEQ